MPMAPDSSGDDRGGGDDAPWITVSANGSRRRRRHAVDAAIDFHDPFVLPAARVTRIGPGAENGAAAAVATTNTAASSAIVHIGTEHARIAERWRGQPSYFSLNNLILAHASSHAAVTRAVCLGAGSFGGPLDFGESIRRAHVQTEAFLCIVDLLGRHSGHPIMCFFQEPLYTDADKGYLQSLGHSVIETPAASQMISSTTLVFAVHLPTREYLGCLFGDMPAMLVGTTFDRYEELPQFSGDEASHTLANLRGVHLAFREFEFPREKHDHCFSDTSIYWRPVDVPLLPS